MRYSRTELAKSRWHKCVFWCYPERAVPHDHPKYRADKEEVREALRRFVTGDYMVQSGGDWLVVMIRDDDDAASLRCWMKPHEYRGKKMWTDASTVDL